jgi:hypothetical protein
MQGPQPKRKSAIVNDTVSLPHSAFGRASNRAACLLPLVAVLTLGPLPLFGESSFALDETSNAEPADDGTVDVSHEQWLERIAEAKRRFFQFALKHGGSSAIGTEAIRRPTQYVVGRR